jgi:hypothetical protein
MLNRLSASLTIFVCGFALSCHSQPRAIASDAAAPLFDRPERVSILGYDGDAMEPFISRDGRYLFFNNLNEASVNTNLFWAERIDDLHFRFRGELRGINTPALEGVASMDRQGNFYFVSTRSYDSTASTLYRGRFTNGEVTAIELVPGISLAKPGIVNFDAEISANGDTLYFVESQFNRSSQPKSAKLVIAHRRGETFVRDDRAGDAILRAVNTGGLTYAPDTSASECEFFFTRADANGPAIYRSVRADPTQPFGEPVRLSAITGFVEAPTLSPDEKSLYFHKRENGRFVLYRVTRQPPAL